MYLAKNKQNLRKSEGRCVTVCPGWLHWSPGRAWRSGRRKPCFLCSAFSSIWILTMCTCHLISETHPSPLEPVDALSVPRSAISWCSQERPYILSCHQNSRTSAWGTGSIQKSWGWIQYTQKVKAKTSKKWSCVSVSIKKVKLKREWRCNRMKRKVLYFTKEMYWTQESGVSPVEIYGNTFWLHV